MKKYTVLFIYLLGLSPLLFGQNTKILPAAARAVSARSGIAASHAAARRQLLQMQQESLPAVRHANRQQAKAPIAKFRPAEQDIALWAKLKTGHLTGRGLNKSSLIDKIVQRNHNMNAALQELRQLEKIYGQQDFFHLFSTAYYRKVLKGLTPSFYDFLKQISLLRNPQIQNITVKRMQFLFSHQNNFKNILQDSFQENGKWSLYWLPVFQPTGKAPFTPQRIILSYERTLYPDKTDISMEHIRADSKIQINGNPVRVVHFQEDLKYLPQFYQQLLYKKPEGKPLFVAVDRPNRLMIVFNEAKNKWVRISKHEFANPEGLHIHLNRVKNIHFKTGKNKVHADKMLINLRIPIESRPYLTPQELEDIFFNQTIRQFETMPNVYISYQSLY